MKNSHAHALDSTEMPPSEGDFWGKINAALAWAGIELGDEKVQTGVDTRPSIKRLEYEFEDINLGDRTIPINLTTEELFALNKYKGSKIAKIKMIHVVEFDRDKAYGHRTSEGIFKPKNSKKTYGYRFNNVTKVLTVFK